MHGKTTEIEHDGSGLFAGLQSPLTVGRYHSLVVDPDLPDCLEPTAHGGGVLMAMRHRELPAHGVQFHPESVLTPDGKRLLENFLLPNPVLTEAIDALVARQDLSAEDTAPVLAEIMDGEASEVQTAGVLIALRTKGETVEELVGLAPRCAASPRRSTPVARTCSTPRAPAAGGRPSTSRRPRR